MNTRRLCLQAAGVAVLTLSSGCYTTVISSGRPAEAATVAYDGRLHSGLLWGMGELSGPYDLSEVCPNGWAEIETETSFVDGLMATLSYDFYSPQSVTVRCAMGDAAAVPPASPPASPPAPASAPVEAAPATAVPQAEPAPTAAKPAAPAPAAAKAAPAAPAPAATPAPAPPAPPPAM